MSDWSGEPGYVHCLLTGMSEGALTTFEIDAAGPVPDLLELMARDDGLRKWIASQDVRSDTLNARKIIRVLRRNTRVRGLPFMTRRQELPAMNAINDSGEVFPSIFDICIGPFDRFAKIERAPDDDPRVVAMIPDVEAANKAVNRSAHSRGN